MFKCLPLTLRAPWQGTGWFEAFIQREKAVGFSEGSKCDWDYATSIFKTLEKGGARTSSSSTSSRSSRAMSKTSMLEGMQAGQARG